MIYVKRNELGAYLLTKMELLMLWLNNYEFGESLLEITEWVKFQAMDEFAQRLVRAKKCSKDETFLFNLILDDNEEKSLYNYLLKRKEFVIKYIFNRKSFSPNTHLYQLYLQYLPSQLNEVEKNILLDGYMNMLKKLYGDNCIAQKRLFLEKNLNLR